MKLIRFNSFRLLGVLAGTSPRNILSRLNTLRIYLSADEEIPQEEVPYGFEIMGKIVRNHDALNEANTQLNMPHEKFLNGIFWFYKGSKVGDTEAFDCLREGDVESAKEIWEAVIGGREVNFANASAYHNLSILKINAAFKSNRVFVKILEEGVLLQLKFMESNSSTEFLSSIIDKYEEENKKEHQLLFLKAIQDELDKFQNVSANKLIEIVSKIDFSGKQDFLNLMVQRIIQRVENLLAETQGIRSKQANESWRLGLELIEKTEESIESARKILGQSHLRYRSLCDKIAEELLQCGQDYFNELKESEKDPGEEVKELFKYAKSIAKGESIKNQIDENIEGLNEWIENASEREKHKLIKRNLDSILKNITEVEGLPNTISTAKRLVDACWPELKIIKKTLGSTDELYLNISGAVINRAQNLLISNVNRETEASRISLQYGIGSRALNAAVEGALEVSFKLGSFGMDAEQRARFDKNLAALKRLAKQINISTEHPKEKLQKQLKDAESRLRDMANYIPFADRIVAAQNELDIIKEWHFLRSQATREREIAQQEKIIRALQERSNNEKAETIKRTEEEIAALKKKINLIDY